MSKTVPTPSLEQSIIHFQINGTRVTFFLTCYTSSFLFKFHVNGLFLLIRFNDTEDYAHCITFPVYNSNIKTTVNALEYISLVAKELLMNTVFLLFSNQCNVVDIEDPGEAFHKHD